METSGASESERRGRRAEAGPLGGAERGRVATGSGPPAARQSDGESTRPSPPPAASGRGPLAGRPPRAGDRVGEYVLEEPIGEGGCGVVWRARHALLPGTTVAVKLPRDLELIELLRRESLLQHGLRHPGIVRVLGVDLEAPVPYVVQEFAEGGDLARRLAEQGPLRAPRALALFREIVEVVAHAHSRGVVHGDLKPRNILLDASGHARIADFGLGRGLERLGASAIEESIRSGEAGASVAWFGGTLEYMPPEQRRAAGAGAPPEADPSADVYALGIILHEILTGERPAGRVDLEGISPGLDRVFARAWTSRERRYPSARELLDDLKRIGRAELRPQPAGVPASGAERAPRRPSGRGWRVASVAVPAAMILAGLSFFVFEYERQAGSGVSPREAASAALADRARAVAKFDPSALEGDEAEALGALRRSILAEPPSSAEALRRLGEFRAKAESAGLRALARRWEKAIEEAAEPAEYEVCWRGYALRPESYRRRLHAALEPGSPDVYLRVWRTRDGKEGLVFDSSGRVAEGWEKDWSSDPEPPRFRLQWKSGEALRVELREADVFGDDSIAEYRMEGDLSILLLSSPRRSAEGHSIRLESDFGFGK